MGKVIVSTALLGHLRADNVNNEGGFIEAQDEHWMRHALTEAGHDPDNADDVGWHRARDWIETDPDSPEFNNIKLGTDDPEGPVFDHPSQYREHVANLIAKEG